MHNSSATVPRCGKDLAHLLAGFAEFLKRMLRSEAVECLALQLRDRLSLGERFGHWLVVHFGQFRFVVEGFQVRWRHRP